MLRKTTVAKTANQRLEALNRSQAVISFNRDGTILDANRNFLDALGYQLEDVRGKHHRMFVENAYAASSDYSSFWERLKKGEFQAAEYKRIGKDGKEVWIQATYNPILDTKGNTVQVVKYATDVTDQKQQTADFMGQIAAIRKSQAVIEFNLDGTIIDANDHFLNAVGYGLDEVRGRHHRMFVEPSYGSSPAYTEFWEALNRGEYQSAEYMRMGKDGREIWIQASYNPIFDMNGKPFKVVKYATDITTQKMQSADFTGQLAAINKAQAVIEFSMDGTITHANPNFLGAVGYSLEEVKGKHHRIFVDTAYAESVEYADFWRHLNAGDFQAAEYKRFGKGGKEVYIQATYNPIMDANGRPFKVVKYATDISGLVAARREVSASSELTLLNVQSVTSAAEELTASINEIAKNTVRSKTAVEDINAKVKMTDESTAKLQQATSDMDNIVKLIESIASQINLLALNATIESARAGEAGKGFAVVAGEVKSLASQTTLATQRISQEIQGVQQISQTVVSALTEISATIDMVNELVGGTASAIEEQGAVTREISSNMQNAAQGVSSINEQLGRIANA